MGGFTKLFSDIVLSSIWSEDDKTRIVWITLLATSNADGFVSASLPGLAAAARVTIEECEASLTKLVNPDPHSRTKDHEGRRIEPVDGGWLILNYRLYRDRTSDDPNAIKVRERVRRHRERRQQEAPLPPAPPTRKTTEAEDRSRSSVTLRNVTVTPTLEEVLAYASEIHLPEAEARKHFDHYTANGWRISKNPVKDWKATLRNWQRRFNEGDYKTGTTRAGNQNTNRITGRPGRYAHIGTTL